MHILIVTPRSIALEEFLTPLSELPEAKIIVAETGATALEMIKTHTPSFAIIDEGLSDFEPLPLVTEIMKINAMINTAVFSSMTAKEFHDFSEGLGVLAPIPPNAGKEDGIKLKELFTRFM